MRMLENRVQAGKLLAKKLLKLHLDRPVVIALPRGGVPVAAQIAERLQAPLDVLVVCKVGAPGHPEYGIGAVTEEGPEWLNREAIRAIGISESQLSWLLEKELKKVVSRVRRYRGDRPLMSVEDRTVILVDDGLATGVTALAAIQYLKHLGAKNVTVAIPICARETEALLRFQIEHVVFLEAPEPFFAVGQAYLDFPQVSDEEVVTLLSGFEPQLRSGAV